ncbi:MAG: HAD-IA family hydrolase [Caldimonas sp.]
MRYDAIAFDTGGTVLDWHGTLVDELARLPAWQGVPFDRHEFANAWRRGTMKGIVGQAQPAFNMDDVHLRALDEAVQAFALPMLDAQSRHDLWRAWHRLRAWPDFAPALALLRERLPVVSFTMLPTALVVDVSRRNGFTWDAIVSCEMIGVYKPHREAYVTAARWMNLAPDRILMVACHNFDLNAAHGVGMRTAFVARPDEWGPAGPPDPHPNMAYDHIVDGFTALCEQVLRAD